MAQQTTTFEDLPSEIRNTIYEHALISDANIELFSQDGTGSIESWSWYYSFQIPKPAPSPRHLAPGLLGTNSLVHAEALPILYGANTFEFSSTQILTVVSHPPPWLRHIRLMRITDIGSQLNLQRVIAALRNAIIESKLDVVETIELQLTWGPGTRSSNPPLRLAKNFLSLVSAFAETMPRSHRETLERAKEVIRFSHSESNEEYGRMFWECVEKLFKVPKKRN